MHLVREIKGVNNYELVLLFNNNEIRKINFEPKLKEWTTYISNHQQNSEVPILSVSAVSAQVF